MLLSIPWLVLPVLAYFGFTIFAADVGQTLTYPIIEKTTLISGGEWTFTVSDALLIFTLIILFVEILKATRVSSLSLVDHSLSTLLFIVNLILFVTYAPAGSSTFFMITFMTLIDVVAGFSITLRAARRDVGFGGHPPH
ncbi:MAG: hypothetical protein ACRBBN_13135 [Methyloligellaceae bacterium]